MGSMDKPEIYTWATEGFQRFNEVWEFKDFWTRGNTFDAALRFVMAAKSKWPDDPGVKKMESDLGPIVSGNQTYYVAEAKNGDLWADDFGWWGVAWLTAREYALGSGDPETASSYLDLAVDSWVQLVTRGYDWSDLAQPVRHGCANATSILNMASKYYCSVFRGTKNTVTNALLFVLSVRLHAVVKTTNPQAADVYMAMAYSQYLWFSSWLHWSGGYLRKKANHGGLVLALPDLPPDYGPKHNDPWQDGFAWTGDQGLILGSLIGIFGVKDDLYGWAKTHQVSGFDPTDFETNVTDWISVFATGVWSLLFGGDFQGTDDVLREPPFTASYESDPKDYVCGRGVLARYIAQAGGPPFPRQKFNTMIMDTAKAVWDARDATNDQFRAAWNSGRDQTFYTQFVDIWGNGDEKVQWGATGWGECPMDAILQATGLDVIGAAISFLP